MPINCSQCGELNYKFETCDEVTTSYNFDLENNEWIESDIDWQGATTVRYECSSCGFEEEE
jgi:predicted RNA-binding Zn-ribbon protein involved in translation (DUF1610 family)